ncbi:MAG: beta-ketoacyl synthase N-terminal-like domain-containing protein [Umezawaea sp.]
MISVTGLGVVTAIGLDVLSFTESLRAGRSATEITGFDFAERMDRFPHGLVDAARPVAASPFPVQVAVVAAVQAWESARLHETAVPPDRVGLIVGGNNLTARYSYDRYAEFVERPGRLRPSFVLQSLDTDHVGTVSEVLGILGEGHTVGGASAAGGVALVGAARMITSGEVDVCLVVGAMLDLGPMERRALLGLGAMTQSTAGMRPFDAAHSGFVPGQGGACLVLESGESAWRRGAHVQAVLAGCVTRLAGNRLADPSVDAEATVIREALRRAGVDASELSYVNTHGSGSPIGDVTEIHALRAALGAHLVVPLMNSTKGLTGHCLTAAGVVEAVATIVQMDGGFVHPNVNLCDPIDRGIRFAGTHARQARLEVALSNSFGFGGFNSAAVFTRPERWSAREIREER